MNSEKVLIIAEAGVNHNGDLKLAKQLIRVAAEAGADIVKFQTFQANAIASKVAGRADYQKANMKEDGSQIDMLKKLQLSDEDHLELIEHCKKNKIEFLSTAFDFPSIDLLTKLGITLWKIPSGEITNLPYLRKIGSLGQRVILSTGMADLGEIEDALDALISAGTPLEKIIVLHCTTEYPTPLEDVNLKAMITIRESFKVNIGYSDHTPGIEVPIAALALGAKVIEKHFTLDKNLPGPDHKASLEPFELKEMVRTIRNIEKALGSGIKKPSNIEKKNIPIARKSIVASKNIQEGEVLTIDNLTVKRPGTGISPMRWEEVLGRRSVRNFSEDEIIEL